MPTNVKSHLESPATSSAPTATAVVNVAAPTTTPTETPKVAAMTPAPTPVPLNDTTVATGTGVDNPCIICPDGTDVDDFAPYPANIDPRTCAELIDAAKLSEIGSDSCGWFEYTELRCCFTAPEIPCNICPAGATAGDDYVPEYEDNSLTCSELIEHATRFESGSDACGSYDIDVPYCCPP